jgi:hypothetical protein
MGYSSPFRCEIKSIIDNWNIIGSDGSRAGVDEETALVCHKTQGLSIPTFLEMQTFAKR